MKSRFIEVDGYTVLKANNYTLEEGESSVWASEAEQAPPPPRKPFSAYMLFGRKWRADRIASAAAAEAEAAAATLMSLEAPGLTQAGPRKRKADAIDRSDRAGMEAIVRAWKELGEEDKLPFIHEAEAIREAYDAEVKTLDFAHPTSSHFPTCPLHVASPARSMAQGD